MAYSTHGRIAAVLIAALIATTAWTSETQAAGFAVARFGGEHGHPTTSNPTAIYYNPAGIMLHRGTNVFIDTSFALRYVSYDRPESAIDNPLDPSVVGDEAAAAGIAANSGEAELSNQAFVPFLGVSSDFGTDWFSAGLAAYVPFGGSAVWSPNANADAELYPGSPDGIARWYSIDGTIKSLYVTTALAFHIEAANLSIGVSGSAIKSTVNTIRARNADGTDDLVTVKGDGGTLLKEGRSHLNVDGWQAGMGAGIIWQPNDNVWLGASYTSQPNIAGGMTLSGTLRNVLNPADPSETNVEVTQTLPDIIRLGARVRPEGWNAEIRLFMDYTRWSVFENQCVLNADEPDRNCDFVGGENALEDPAGYRAGEDWNAVVQNLPRFWQDSVGIRFGGSYWLEEELELYLGAGYDSSAVPPETMDPALFDLEKITATAGTRWQASELFGLGVTFTQVIYFDLDTDGRSINPAYAKGTNTVQTSSDGVYSQAVSVLNIYSEFTF